MLREHTDFGLVKRIRKGRVFGDSSIGCFALFNVGVLLTLAVGMYPHPDLLVVNLPWFIVLRPDPYIRNKFGTAKVSPKFLRIEYHLHAVGPGHTVIRVELHYLFSLILA